MALSPPLSRGRQSWVFNRMPRSIHRRRWTKLLHLGVGRQHAGAVDIFEVAHGALAVLQRDLADIGAHGGLLVAGTVFERPERAIDLEAAERRDQLSVSVELALA